MRGKFLHNQILVSRLEEAFHNLGGTTRIEHRVGHRFIDLFVEWEGWRFVIEVELTADRVANDVVKAVAAQADLLLIVSPNRRAAAAVNRKLARLSVPSGLVVWSLPFGPALQRLANKSRLMTALNISRSSNPKIPGGLL